MTIKRNKIKENKKERGRVISRQNVWGDEKIKRRKKVGESLNVKKNEYNLMSTIFFYLNLSKILLLLFFKQKERENINNLIIRRMWLNFDIE